MHSKKKTNKKTQPNTQTKKPEDNKTKIPNTEQQKKAHKKAKSIKTLLNFLSANLSITFTSLNPRKLWHESSGLNCFF